MGTKFTFLSSTVIITVCITMSDGTQHPKFLFNCVIEGDNIAFPILMEQNCLVGFFKEMIQSERAMGILKDVDPHTLTLWKVSTIDEPLL